MMFARLAGAVVAPAQATHCQKGNPLSAVAEVIQSKGPGASPQVPTDTSFYLESISSSGLCKRSLPRLFVKIPSRCHSLKVRLTVNGVTFAPAARSSFPILISTPSVQTLPIPQARLSNRFAMRPRASSDIKEILAEIAHAICSVTAMERALSNNTGKRVTNSRTVFLSQTSKQLSGSTSVLTRYR